MSDFLKFSKKRLVQLANILLENGFEYEDSPYDNFDKNFEILSSITKVMGLSETNEDVEFFCKLIQDNLVLIQGFATTNDSSLLDEIEIPKIQKFEIDVQSHYTGTITETYRNDWYSYDELWVDDAYRTAFNDGLVDHYEGRLIDTETNDLEFQDWYINNIRRIRDEVSESSNIKKVIVENTQDIINRLDKQSLLQLKKSIDSRLRKL